MSTTLSASPGQAPAPPPGGFEVGYTTGDGARLRVPLADAAMVRFADMQPSRRFRARKGQQHLPGRWWSVTNGRHVGYVSWLEREGGCSLWQIGAVARVEAQGVADGGTRVT